MKRLRVSGLCGAVAIALSIVVPVAAWATGEIPGPADGPFALKTNPQNLPTTSQKAGFPATWSTAYQNERRNGVIASADVTKGVRWMYAGARAWPLDKGLYGQDQIPIKVAETTAAQWLGSTMGVSAAQGMIFMESNDQFVYALNAETGKLVWRASPAASTFMGQPLVEGNRVFVNAGTVGFNFSNVIRFRKTGQASRGHGVAYNGLFALDANTGALLWSHLTDSDVMPTPVYVDGDLVADDGNGNVFSLNGANGKLVWKTHVGGMANMSSPAEWHGKIFAGTSAPAFLYALDAQTGKVLWKGSIPRTVNTSMGDVSPAVAKGLVVTDGLVPAIGEPGKFKVTVAAFSAADGHIVWSHTTTQAGPKIPAFKGGVPMIHGDTVYVGEPVENIYQAFNLETGKLEWTWHVPDPSQAGSGRGPAAWYQGNLYIATGPSIYKVDAKTGKLLFEKKIGSRFGIVGPVIANGTIYLADSSDWVMAVPVSDFDK